MNSTIIALLLKLGLGMSAVGLTIPGFETLAACERAAAKLVEHYGTKRTVTTQCLAIPSK